MYLASISDADDPVALEGLQAVPNRGHVRRIIPETTFNSEKLGGKREVWVEELRKPLSSPSSPHQIYATKRPKKYLRKSVDSNASVVATGLCSTCRACVHDSDRQQHRMWKRHCLLGDAFDFST